MGLTRTRFIQTDTTKAKLDDPITLLNGSATEANIDVGFIVNRDAGISSNIALFWDESNDRFTVAATTDTGSTNSNVGISSYSDFRIGTVIVDSIKTDSYQFANGASYVPAAVDTLSANNFVSNNSTIGTLTITGNLLYQGNVYSIGTTDLSVADSIIHLHTQANLAPLVVDDAKDVGLLLHYYKTQDSAAFLGWKNTSGYLEWYAAGSEGVGNVFSGTYGTIKSGDLILANATVSSSTSSGALIVTGGAGIGGALYISNTGDVSANIGNVRSNVSAIESSINAFFTYANTKIGTNSSSNLVVTSSADSISATTGALVVNGGIGTGGNIYVGGATYTNGLFWAANNVAIGGPAVGNFSELQYSNAGLQGASSMRFDVVSGNIVLVTTTDSTSTSTGALVVKGGIGATGNIFAGGFSGTHYGDGQYLSNIAAVSATTATNALNTEVTSNIIAGTAYVTFVEKTSGNAAQNVSTALTYNPSTGNLSAYGVLTTTGIYWAGNGVAFSSGGGGGGGGSGITITTDTAPPITGNLAGDQWYNTTSDILYEFIDDGTSTYWVDIVSLGTTGNLNAINILDSTMTGNIIVQFDQIYSIGNEGGRLKNLYAANVNAGNITITSNFSVGNISGTSSNVVFNTDVLASGNILASNIRATSSATSVSTTTGALVVQGGAGVAGNIYVGSSVYTNNGIFWTGNGQPYYSGVASIRAISWAQTMFFGS